MRPSDKARASLERQGFTLGHEDLVSKQTIGKHAQLPGRLILELRDNCQTAVAWVRLPGLAIWLVEPTEAVDTVGEQLQKRVTQLRDALVGP